GTHAPEDGARLQAAQRRARSRPLRRPLLARLVPPHRPGHPRPRVSHPRAAEPFSPAAGLPHGGRRAGEAAHLSRLDRPLPNLPAADRPHPSTAPALTTG